jgi:hypothetical protein
VSVRLAAVHHLSFSGRAAQPESADLLHFWAERLTPHRVAVTGERYSQGRRTSFGSMSQAIVDRCSRYGPLGLVISAHSGPDADARQSVAGELAETNALVFAVSDHGRLTPFCALRVAEAYPECGRALVIALDQDSIPYPDADRPASEADHAVGLLLGPHGASGRLRLLQQVGPPELAGVVAAELAAAEPDLVIAGPAVPAAAAYRTVRTAPDQPCTAVWAALAAELTTADSAPRRVAVIEHDPRLHALGVLLIDLPAGGIPSQSRAQERA